MVIYALLQERDEWVNVTGVYNTREEAEGKKLEREELEKDWKLYSRFEYSIMEIDLLQLVKDIDLTKLIKNNM